MDVCYYVVALGYANTTLPPHITFSGSDPSNQDLSGFELLFHEASHTFADTIMNALSAEGRTQHEDVGDLWHSLLFHTSGVELRRLLPAPEQASFTPYAYQFGVYRGYWREYRRVLETDWQAYLDGKTSFPDCHPLNGRRPAMKVCKGSDGKPLDEQQILSSNRRVTDHARGLSYPAREFKFERNLSHEIGGK